MFLRLTCALRTYKGADIFSLLEKTGVRYADSGNVSPLSIVLKDYGADAVRVRAWTTRDDCDLDYGLALAKSKWSG